MTEIPKGVRLAQAGDEKRLFDLCVIAHGENGYGILDPNAIRSTIARAIARQGCMFGIIDGPERIEATLGLDMIRPWYASNDASSWYWVELGIVVHPLHRRSRHAIKLIHFARWVAETTKMPVCISLMPLAGDLDRKDKLFSRYGKRVSSSYLFGEMPSFKRDIVSCAA